MDNNSLTEWLQKLADAVSCEPKLGTVEVYLEELARWKLTGEQWMELRRRAVLRHHWPGKLPLLAELYDISCEVCEETRLAEESRQRRQELEGSERVPCPPDVRLKLNELFKNKPN